MFLTLDFLKRSALMQIPIASVNNRDIVNIKLCDISIRMWGFCSTVGMSVILIPANMVL